MHWVFLILSLYSQVSQIPFISLYFKAFQGVSALRFASALANVNEEKEGEKEKISQFPISSHTARALCPDSEIMREKKDRARKKKIRAENEKKRSTLREKENTGNCPFENIGFYLVIYSIFPKLFLGMKIPPKIKDLGCFGEILFYECVFGMFLGNFWRIFGRDFYEKEKL